MNAAAAPAGHRAARRARRRRRSGAPLGDRRRHHHRASRGDDGVHRRAMGRDAAVARRDDRPAHAARLRGVRREQPRHDHRGGRPRGRAPRRTAVFVRAAVHRGSRRNARHVPRDQHGRRPRLRRRHHQCEHDARAGVRRDVHDHVPAGGRALDAVPRILRHRARGDVGARARHSGRRVRSRAPPAAKG